MELIDLTPGDGTRVRRTAELLVEGFRNVAPDWLPTLDAALQAVQNASGDEHVSRVAVGREGEILGWIAGHPLYGGKVWELHPLVVHPGRRGEGIGRALVRDFERIVRDRGAYTIWLGTDDEMGLTSLAGVDLYPDPLAHLARIRNLRNHPYGFYLKLGFVLAGVVPDANGPGKPDILMAKRVAPA